MHKTRWKYAFHRVYHYAQPSLASLLREVARRRRDGGSFNSLIHTEEFYDYFR